MPLSIKTISAATQNRVGICGKTGNNLWKCIPHPLRTQSSQYSSSHFGVANTAVKQGAA